ncbi:MAG: prepilin-type N-terminal cleavage/methylation domain-containing protein [Planctomycetota bacterium]|nr:prepilin-type N-terminal cleavage/methylation domain-containing protein [Planctomycetota bacterium]
MISTNSRADRRRGLTLVEMLVVVALTVLLMTIIAQIFQATTGAIQIARAYQEIEQDLRAVEGTIKRDLAGVTAKFTPPLNPKDGLGYFEYGENEFADAQGEDSDDYLAFTTTSTDGNLFYGRHLPAMPGMPSLGADTRATRVQVAPVVVTSDTAEVVYFLRNGNLYRRVFLVKPTIRLNHEYAFNQNGVYQGVNVANMPGITGTNTQVGWQALNDISMRPAETIELAYGTARQNLGLPFPGQMVFDTYMPDVSNTNLIKKYASDVRPIANSLSDLTNRQNRAFKPRFTNDYYTPVYSANGLLANILPYPDGNADDFMGAAFPNTDGNFDNQIDDFTPATYPNLIANKHIMTPFGVGVNEPLNAPPAFSPFPLGTVEQGYDTLGFPFVYPNAYSRTANYDVPYAANIPRQGAIHGIAFEPPKRQYDLTNATDQGPTYSSYFLPYWNHNPLEAEDNLLTPSDPQQTQYTIPNRNNSYQFYQTWWGFPTWREQLSPFWIDPLKRLNAPMQVTLTKPAYQLTTGMQPYGLSWNAATQPYGWLPEMVGIRNQKQLFAEGEGPVVPRQIQSGGNSYFYNNMSIIWETTWEDDLIASNVRSFDVKAFEPLPEIQSYVDLGYLATITGGKTIAPAAYDPTTASNTTTYNNWLQGFGHEGRMPPLTTDFRLDEQYSFIPGVGMRYLGDDDPGVIRLRRVWDSWSTDYSAVDAKTLDPLGAPPFQPAPRPSYPAPYPAPLRGIQIQIRMTDPRQERVRTITIHQDFTSKL